MEINDLHICCSLYVDNTKFERIRLSSLEPWDIDSSFFDLWQNPRLCPHLHLPLQSGSTSVLQRMARKITPEKFQGLVEAARAKIPNLAVTTDIIVGFPGETDLEFEESLQTIKEMNFSGGHVFKYSRRDETAAAKFPLQISGKVSRDTCPDHPRDPGAMANDVLCKIKLAKRTRFYGKPAKKSNKDCGLLKGIARITTGYRQLPLKTAGIKLTPL